MSRLKTVPWRKVRSEVEETEDDGLELEISGGGSETTVKTSESVNTYSIYLTDSVGSIDEYSGLAETLSKATDRDKVIFYLANYGGSCHGCVYVINLMRLCKAPIDAVITAPCYSAGTSIALAADSITFMPNTFLMFHNYTSFTGGKGGELILGVDQTKRWIHTYFRDVHSPFLSKSEIRQMERDQDVYVHFDDPDLEDRIGRHFRGGGVIMHSTKKKK